MINKPYVRVSEDGAICIEFVKGDRRFNIIIEKDLKESSWNYVSHTEMTCELLDSEMVYYLKKFDQGGDNGNS